MPKFHAHILKYTHITLFDAVTHAKHMPPTSVLNRLAVDLPDKFEGITAPPSTTKYVFHDDGDIWKERKPDTGTETVGLRVLLARLVGAPGGAARRAHAHRGAARHARK
jgi:hypothetical protein